MTTAHVPMDGERFAHMLMLSSIHVELMRSGRFFDGVEGMDVSDKHNMLTCMAIVAETFVEMQQRLGVKPKFTMKARVS
jgi:hypothetical protein